MDKKKIYQDEKKWFLEWLKTICGTISHFISDLVEKPFEDVRVLADRLVKEGNVSSINALISELSDGDGHKAIHFAVSRNHLDTTKWILDEDSSSVQIFDDQ